MKIPIVNMFARYREDLTIVDRAMDDNRISLAGKISSLKAMLEIQHTKNDVLVRVNQKLLSEAKVADSKVNDMKFNLGMAKEYAQKGYDDLVKCVGEKNALTAEHAALLSRATRLEAEKMSQEGDLNLTRNQLQLVYRERTEALEKNTALEEGIAAMKGRVAEREGELDDFSKANVRLVQNAGNLKAEIKTLRRMMTEIRKSSPGDYTTLRNEINAKDNDLGMLRRQLVEESTARTKLGIYNTKLYKENLNLREQMARNESWSAKAGGKLADCLSKDNRLMERNDSLQGSVISLRKQNDELRDKVKMIKASRKMIAMDEKSFDTLLTELINRFSKESGSNTPDFILAKYLTETLAAFDKATTTREGWFISPPWGCKPEKGVVTFTIS